MVHISIRHRNIVVDDIVKAAANEKITRLCRFVPGVDHAEVTFMEERNPRIGNKEFCEVTMKGNGHIVRAKASAASTSAALDLVVEKLEHQMLKLKGKVDRANHGGPKRGNHHSPGLHQVPISALAVLEKVELNGNGAAHVDSNEAQIVRRKQFVVDPISAEEAGLRMDMLQHDFFLFTNAETGRAAVIYRREDGHLGLIDAA